jgi:hypothetical protein
LGWFVDPFTSRGRMGVSRKGKRRENCRVVDFLFLALSQTEGCTKGREKGGTGVEDEMWGEGRVRAKSTVLRTCSPHSSG